jgi:hypothetical protein
MLWSGAIPAVGGAWPVGELLPVEPELDGLLLLPHAPTNATADVVASAAVIQRTRRLRSSFIVPPRTGVLG